MADFENLDSLNLSVRIDQLIENCDEPEVLVEIIISFVTLAFDQHATSVRSFKEKLQNKIQNFKNIKFQQQYAKVVIMSLATAAEFNHSMISYYLNIVSTELFTCSVKNSHLSVEYLLVGIAHTFMQKQALKFGHLRNLFLEKYKFIIADRFSNLDMFKNIWKDIFGSEIDLKYFPTGNASFEDLLCLTLNEFEIKITITPDTFKLNDSRYVFHSYNHNGQNFKIVYQISSRKRELKYLEPERICIDPSFYKQIEIIVAKYFPYATSYVSNYDIPIQNDPDRFSLKIDWAIIHQMLESDLNTSP